MCCSTTGCNLHGASTVFMAETVLVLVLWLQACIPRHLQVTQVSMQVLGSLELLGNPTGLLYALSQGMHDLVAMPLEAESAGQARTILLWNRHTCLLKYSLGVDDILVPVFPAIDSGGQGMQDEEDGPAQFCCMRVITEMRCMPITAGVGLTTARLLQFLAGLGLGSTALLRNVSGWGLSSMAGFSSAAARALQRSLSGPGEPTLWLQALL